MTSNAGAQSIVSPKHLGFGSQDDEKQNYEYMKQGVMEEVRRIFKPEFLNRIDETIVFPCPYERRYEADRYTVSEDISGALQDTDGDRAAYP